ncbi:hypothetical protein E4U42_005887 [Claviceps africana]|uniref:Uncharacterized protein n=1 Tax=Claviceps africana TaxID=83212 RepID=A0A8K0JBL4_9HYPO|nr:hypothetical protein E4U42_005887 [Claviceps africana]
MARYPKRHSPAAPHPTHSFARGSILGDESDDLTVDTIPCSPSAFLRDRSREPDVTQPTQILTKPELGPSDPSSSPTIIIEVPASSPFQKRKEPSAFGNLLAPKGTLFRPPSGPSPSATKPKRPAADSVCLVSDEEGDSTPPRGDIRSTSFKAKVAEFTYNATSEEQAMKMPLRQMYDAIGDKYSSDRVREALKACHNDPDDAIIWLETRPAKREKSNSPESAKPTSRRLISKASMQHRPGREMTYSRDSSPTLPWSSPNAEQPQKSQKRRLVQGLKLRNRSSPRKTSARAPSPIAEPVVINLVDSPGEDTFEAESSPSASPEDGGRVLACLNTSTLKELAAMTGLKLALLEHLIEKRPFNNLSQARRVSVAKKAGVRKSSRVSIGESVVDAVHIFLNAVQAIDEVVAKCESKGQDIKTVMDAWDIDNFGHDKRSSRASPYDDIPPTPTSSSSKYTRPLIPQQPDLMEGHCQMKPFQLFGLNWMFLLYSRKMGCILADEMGLGKTCQVISFMCHLVEQYEQRPGQRRPWPNLIVVPPSTYNNWLQEFERFAPNLSVVGYRGSQSERAEIAYMIQEDPEEYHVVLATYSQITTDEDIGAMMSFHLNAAVFDEGHKLKNPETKLYKDLGYIPAVWRLLLTGTPVQNNLLEMTALLNFINPKMFVGYMNNIQYIFSQKVTIRDISNGAFLYSERVTRARTILEPFILQRRKDQVLSDMPQKMCTVVHCDMTEVQKEVYAEYERFFKLEPAQRAAKANTNGRQNDQNNSWMQLRKAALHPLLFRRHFTDRNVKKMGKILMDRVSQSELHQPNLKHLVQELKNSSDFELHLWCRDYPQLLRQFDIPSAAELGSGKVKKLLELIHQYRENGDRVLVFSKFSRLIELLQEVLTLQDIGHRVLIGSTDVAERQGLIDEFNDDANIPVFLLTTGAGGTGINLTAANKVIIFDQSDNPQDDIQAENRAHRLGQKRDVEVVRLISSQTIEELIYKACQKKIELANKVTGGMDESQDDAGRNMEQVVREMMLHEQGEELTPP